MSDSGTSPPRGVDDAPASVAKTRRLGLIWLVLALVVVAAGLAGVDWWIYVHVSQQINTGDPLSADFYQRHKLTWNLARYGVYAAGLLTVWLVIVNGDGAARRRVVAGLVGVAVAAGVANLLQMAIGRARPNQADEALAAPQLTFHWPPFSGLWTGAPDGLPSGEAGAAFAIAAVCARLAPAFGPVFFALASVTAAARMLPGMHYLSDVVLGAAVGAWLAAITMRRAEQMLQRLRSRIER